ncbi:Scr1 family TA system antitoxin-like transcriptional regulator [Sphaerisporangium sp. TRM90804]|uniref:Scr1 family TA system antitoxin-like transcriptional regulator n=1 Tax=Sphaerisporangium sp. TRM90804 TaxID=3031113 RepID=UPI00244D4FF0|nr:Scr1 family TA system antitoxin-like transcriptional regulator [Sphaerisporangium sp. TRM90804]MDH2428142.1 Scr1 family TA system antitoxin-like transcriptional regulator [Sphaerisporangium sp. TRM90804]
MERRRLLSSDQPLRLWAIMDEAAVRRQVGGAAGDGPAASVADRYGRPAQASAWGSGGHSSPGSRAGACAEPAQVGRRE